MGGSAVIQKGVFWVLVPLAGLSAFLIWRGIEAAPDSAESAPIGTAADTLIPLWRAEVEAPNGQRLEIRLAPLHGERQRMRFDAARLKRLYELPPGEPWRLEFTGTDERSQLARQWPTVVDVDGVALRSFRVVAGLGLVESSDAKGVGKFRSPIDSLLGNGSGALGDTDCHILWGRAPRDAAELILSEKPSESGKSDANAASYPLLRGESPCEEQPRYMARLKINPPAPKTDPSDD